MDKKFQIGDVVILNSGGESMTVEGYTKEEPVKVICVWFLNSQVQRDSFVEATLRVDEPIMPFTV
jgi:uncharacterized protein YodC (DUF2158 family)